MLMPPGWVESGWHRPVTSIECPQCEANIGPLDGGSLGRHDTGCSLAVEHCAHEWMLVEDYKATTGYRVRDESDGVLTLSADSLWDESYDVIEQYVECSECQLKRPMDGLKITWD